MAIRSGTHVPTPGMRAAVEKPMVARVPGTCAGMGDRHGTEKRAHLVLDPRREIVRATRLEDWRGGQLTLPRVVLADEI